MQRKRRERWYYCSSPFLLQNLRVQSLQKDYDSIKKNLADLSDAVLAVADAQKRYGTVDNERARTILAMYAALLSMGEKAGASPEDSVKNAGFVMYAYLGGQARRDVTVLSENHG